MIMYNIFYLLVQFGTDPDHIPLSKHILVSDPHNTHASSHVYLAVVPKYVFITWALPLSGVLGFPQITAKSFTKQN